jgi:hypothetical protein
MNPNVLLGLLLMIVGVFDFLLPNWLKTLTPATIKALRVLATGFMVVGLGLVSGYIVVL